MESNPTAPRSLARAALSANSLSVSGSAHLASLLHGDVDDLARLGRGEFRQIEEERGGTAAEPNSTDGRTDGRHNNLAFVREPSMKIGLHSFTNRSLS